MLKGKKTILFLGQVCILLVNNKIPVLGETHH